MAIHLDADWARKVLLPRDKAAHKGSFGALTIIAGCTHYRGAAVLAVAGALRSGVGIVRLASTQLVCAGVAAQQPCCIFQPLRQNPQGGIAAVGLRDALKPPATTILAGCGLGNTDETALLVAGLLERCPCPLVLDADALNAVAGHQPAGRDEIVRQAMLRSLKNLPQPVIITPHIGEMARLCDITAEEVAEDREGIALQFAKNNGCVVVLKSHITVVATPEGKLYINSRAGNPGLAKGGSGDVLSGIIAALLAQGHPPEIAGAAGVWLHATAADAGVKATGETGLSPADLPGNLCAVWERMGL